MKVSLYDVSIQEPEIKKQVLGKINHLVQTSQFIGGEEVDSFTKEFAEFSQVPFCAPVANGTDALTLTLRALGLGPGDEVITAPFTFTATAEAIAAVGATVRFVDIHPRSYNMDPNLLERAITPKTKALIPVHLFGHPCDMDPIMDLAKAKNLKVIEDAAQAHGAQYKGRPIGSQSDAACFSFYPTKNLSGFGDGGAVISQSKELIEKILQLANHGRQESYFYAVKGFNSRLDAIQAAVLRIKLKHLNRWTERRRQIASRYNECLQNQSFISSPPIEDYAKHVFHLYSIQSSHRDQLKKYLTENGVGCGVYYPLSLHMQPAFSDCGYKRGDFPVSEFACERILSIPSHPQLLDGQIEKVCGLLKAFSPTRNPQ